MGLPEEEVEEEVPPANKEKSKDKSSDQGSRPGTKASERSGTSKEDEKAVKEPEAEIATFDSKELLEQTRDYFRNMQTERVLFRRRYGEKFIFKSPPL
jgi:hypothetical protein